MASSREDREISRGYDFHSICLFLVSGKTFTFKRVSSLVTNESMITFLYEAMSDGMSKSAYFSRTNVAGYSLTS